MDIKVHSNGGAVKEPIPEKYEQIQPFTKENVDYHPGYDLDSNFKKTLIWFMNYIPHKHNELKPEKNYNFKYHVFGYTGCTINSNYLD